MKYQYLLFLIIILTAQKIAAQSDSLKFSLESIIDEYYEENESPDDDSQLYDYYYRLSLDKTEINTVTFSEMMKIPFMDLNTAKTIFDYRKNFGYIFSFRELAAIKNIDTASLRLITPFISINYKSADNSFNASAEKESVLFRSRFASDIQERKGFINNKFEGSKLKSVQKIRMGFGKNYNFAVTTEKDPGEKSFTDHLSLYFNIKNIGFIKNVVVGNYILEYGQGLALGGNFPQYSNMDALSNFRKFNNSIIPFSGTAEYGVFRGAAATIAEGAFSFSCFYSNNKFDAALDSSGAISSLPVTGLHRTVTELQNRNSGTEKLAGFSISYSNEFTNSGILFYKSDLERRLAIDRAGIPETSYFHVASAYYNFYLDEISLYGETAFDDKNIATINTLSIRTNKEVSFLFSLRNYPEKFFSFHANSFGANSANNEFGIYSGIKVKTDIGIFRLIFDMSKSLAPQRSDLFPYKNNKLFFNYSTNKCPWATFDFRYSYSNQEITLNGLTEKIKADKFRIKITDIRIMRFILKETLYYNHYNMSNSGYTENGFAFIQDVKLKLAEVLTLTARAAVFATDSYKSAVFTYENDLPGCMLSTPLYNKGIRYFLLSDYSPSENIVLSLKYSATKKPAETSLGSGDLEIPGNLDDKISFQAEIRF